MKRILLNLSVLLVTAMLISCEEGLTVDVNTTLTKTITANIEGNLKSADTVLIYPFYKADTLDISENEKIQENMDKIKALDIHEITCELNGIPENEEITEINILIPEAAISVTLSSVNNTNNSVILSVSDELLNALENFLFENKQVSIIISGFSSYAPMQLSVKLDFNSTLETQI